MTTSYFPKAIRSFLTDSQKDRIRKEARRRQSTNEALQLKGRNKCPALGELALKYHELGAGGELAVAAFLDMEDQVFLDQTPQRGSADLPLGIDVKTRARHYYDLLVQLDDDPSKTFVLVTVENKEVLMHGWISGTFAMRDQFIKEYVKGRPCYAIPKAHLSPMLSLKSKVSDASL